MDINIGGKLTGRLGRFDIGILNIEQAAPSDHGTSNLFVARVAADVLSESSLGIIVTNGNPGSALHNTLVGFDFRYLNTRISANRSVIGSAWYQDTHSEGRYGDAGAFGLNVEVPSREGWSVAGSWKEVQEDYAPALGFANRTGVREYAFRLGHEWRLVNMWMRSIHSGIALRRVDQISYGLDSEEIKATVVDFRNRSADRLTVEYYVRRERLRESFEISDGIRIPVSDYTFASYCGVFITGQHRPIAADLRVCGGDFYTGTRLSTNADFIWRPSAHLRVGTGFATNSIDLAEGKFITRLARVRVDIAFTATWYWENLVQYDNISESLGVNSILRWIPQAGREMALVLNCQLEDFDRNGEFQSLYGDVTFKLAYTFRF